MYFIHIAFFYEEAFIQAIEKLNNSSLEVIEYKNGIATGNLGVTLSKKLYELYLIKKSFSTITELKSTDIDTIVEKINSNLNKSLVEEIITLGIPIIDKNNNFYVGDYTLVPTNKESHKINEKNIDKWSKIGWVDLRKKNIKSLIDLLIEVYNHSNRIAKICDNDIYLNFKKITDDYDIAEYLAYYYNLQKKGRIK